MEQNITQRKNWIDAAKVICIFIVLLNHSGIRIPGVNFWGGMFYVPAFFLLAGYTYTPKEESYKIFVKRKAIRLLMPYFAANSLLCAINTLYYAYLGFFSAETVSGPGLRLFTRGIFGVLYARNQFFVPGVNVYQIQQILRLDASYLDILKEIGGIDGRVPLMTFFNAPTWFLPALFLVLICAEGLMRKHEGDKKKVYQSVIKALIVAVIYGYFIPILLPWSLDMVPVFLVFFFVGKELRDGKWPDKMAENPVAKNITTIILLVAVTVVTGLLNGSSNLSIRGAGRNVLFCIVVSVSSTMLLMCVLWYLEKKIPALVAGIAKLGKHTVTILCYHYFIMSMFVTLFGTVESEVLIYVIMFAGIIVAVTACVLFDKILERFTKE